MSLEQILLTELPVDEGIRRKPYVDTVGKITIGVGRNLTDRGLSDEEINYLLNNDITLSITDAKTLFPNFESLSENRQAVLANMMFNMGLSRLSEFLNLLHAIEISDFNQAAQEMLNSTWAHQVGNRAIRLAKQMEIG